MIELLTHNSFINFLISLRNLIILLLERNDIELDYCPSLSTKLVESLAFPILFIFLTVFFTLQLLSQMDVQRGDRIVVSMWSCTQTPSSHILYLMIDNRFTTHCKLLCMKKYRDGSILLLNGWIYIGVVSACSWIL